MQADNQHGESDHEREGSDPSQVAHIPGQVSSGPNDQAGHANALRHKSDLNEGDRGAELSQDVHGFLSHDTESRVGNLRRPADWSFGTRRERMESPGFLLGNAGATLQAACKPNSVEDGHSSRPAITGRLQQPTRRFPLSACLRSRR